MDWPLDKASLTELGIIRVFEFCKLNELPIPEINLMEVSNWRFGVCAYYRPQPLKWTEAGISICVDKCQNPCGVVESRNWTWPGSVTDREPYGVLAHELGHHVDWLTSDKKGEYYGDYSIKTREASGEKPITSYCDNDHEWFAEIFRLFITNPDLLRRLRPKAHELLIRKWKPVAQLDWLEALGGNVPQRVIRTLSNKGADVKPSNIEPTSTN